MTLITTHLQKKWHDREQQLVVSDMEGTLSDGVTWKTMGEWLKQHGRKSEFNRFYYPNLPRGFAYNMGWVR
ncbi:MAG: hypothetical protein AAGD96_32405, partial [Chloroflexota bacterium]